MEIINRPAALPDALRGGTLSIGKFDGLHRGHQEVMKRAIDAARRRGAPAILFTFNPSPVAILRPDLARPPLIDHATKRRLVADAGFDALVEFPTSQEFLNMTATEFLEEIVLRELGAAMLVEGSNFSFGRNREGNAESIAPLARRFNLELEIVPPAYVDGKVASSSAIRHALADGDVSGAALLLGRRHVVGGRVAHGDKIASRQGIPTANLVDIDVFLPQEAVYAAIATTAAGERRPAAVNLGPSPSYGVLNRKVEANILGFDRDLYGERLEIEFCEKLRDIKKFAPGSKELLDQIAQDRRRTEEIVEDALRREAR